MNFNETYVEIKLTIAGLTVETVKRLPFQLEKPITPSTAILDYRDKIEKYFVSLGYEKAELIKIL